MCLAERMGMVNEYGEIIEEGCVHAFSDILGFDPDSVIKVTPFNFQWMWLFTVFFLRKVMYIRIPLLL